MLDFDPAAMKAAAQASGALKIAARYWTANVALRFDDRSYVLEFDNGDVLDFRRDDDAPDGAITISGPTKSWAKMLQTVPPPGFQDPLLSRADRASKLQGIL